MSKLQFQKGEAHYSREELNAITIVARKVAAVMDKLSERDARLLAFFFDPGLDRYVLGGWDKRDIIQQAIEDAIGDNSDIPYWMDNIYDYVESL